MHHNQSDKKEYNSLAPHSNIRTCIKLFPRSEKTALPSPDYNYPAPNFQRQPQKPNRLLFHHFQKFNSSQFEFSRVFDEKTQNNFIQEQVDLFEEVIEKNHNVCILAVGSPASGIKEVCYGQNGNDGIFFSLLTRLWDKLSALLKEGQNHHLTEQSFQPRLLLRLVVIANEKLHDLLNSKSQVTLKEKGQRFILMGCSSYQISTIYNLLIKFREVYEHRKQMYPESIMIIEGEIILSKPIFGKGDYRYFTLVQWQKSGEKIQSNSTNNNHSLLALNKCIYELYKYKCRQQNNQEQMKQLWANFRNSSITKILKNYLIRQSILWTLGCVGLDQSQEKDSYQTLMLCKNISKLNQNNNLKQNFRYKYSSTQKQKLKTEPIHQISQTSELSHLSKVKHNLKRVLQEKESFQKDKQQKSILTLLKRESLNKRELESIRLKKEEIKIREDYGQMLKNVSSNQTSPILDQNNEDRFNSSFALPTIAKAKEFKISTNAQSKTIQNDEIRKLNLLQMRTVNEIDEIHRELSLDRADRDIHKNHSLLQAKIKLQQKQMVAYIEQKEKLLRLLRKQAQQIKQNETFKGKSRGRMITLPANSNSKLNYKHELNYQSENVSNFEESRESIHNEKEETKNENPEDIRQKDSYLKNSVLTKLNKNNYLFERRRLELKFKISKGRVDVSNFYEQAAKRYQEYKSK